MVKPNNARTTLTRPSHSDSFNFKRWNVSRWCRLLSTHKNSSASFSRSVGASVSPSLISWHMFWYLNNLFNTLIASRVLHDIKVNTASIRGRTFAFSRKIYWLPPKIILRKSRKTPQIFGQFNAMQNALIVCSQIFKFPHRSSDFPIEFT